MSAGVDIDPGRTVALMMDYQKKQIQGQQESKRETLIENAGSVLTIQFDW